MSCSICVTCGRDINDQLDGHWLHTDRQGIERHEPKPTELRSFKLGIWLRDDDFEFLPVGTQVADGPVRATKVDHDTWQFGVGSGPTLHTAGMPGIRYCLVRLPWTEPIHRLPEDPEAQPRPQRPPQPAPHCPLEPEPTLPAPRQRAVEVELAAAPRGLQQCARAASGWVRAGPWYSVGPVPVGHASRHEYRQAQIFGIRWTQGARRAAATWEENTKGELRFRVGWHYEPDTPAGPVWKLCGSDALKAILRGEVNAVGEFQPTRRAARKLESDRPGGEAQCGG